MFRRLGGRRGRLREEVLRLRAHYKGKCMEAEMGEEEEEEEVVVEEESEADESSGRTTSSGNGGTISRSRGGVFGKGRTTSTSPAFVLVDEDDDIDVKDDGIF